MGVKGGNNIYCHLASDQLSHHEGHRYQGYMSLLTINLWRIFWFSLLPSLLFHLVFLGMDFWELR
jgi:hypothetical protein